MENEMGMKTVWALAQNAFDQVDMAWCTGLGVDITIEPVYNNVYVQGQLSCKVSTGLTIRITTFCEKQECMLKLKYGPRLVELHRNCNSMA